MSHISVDVGKDAMATPWSLRVSANRKDYHAEGVLHINSPKLSGNVDHRWGNRDVGAGSRSDPGE